MSDLTTISKMIDPEVMADMINAKPQKRLKPFLMQRLTRPYRAEPVTKSLCLDRMGRRSRVVPEAQTFR